MEPITINNETIVTTEQLCRVLQCGESTVRLYKALGMPKFSYNKWIVEDCKRWIKEELPLVRYRRK
jgi:hypothetical protein